VRSIATPVQDAAGIEVAMAPLADGTNVPVQQPTKFEPVINLKIAKVLGLTVPPNVPAITDVVVE
jgi:ABC-type uncharacterized transport system substrate-binding protein